MVPFPCDGIQLHVGEHIVHPAHVPLEVKAQTFGSVLVGNHGESGAFFGNQQFAARQSVHCAGKLFKQGDGSQILPAAVNIGQIVASFPAKIHIQHAADGVYPQSVQMVLFQPVYSAGDEKTLYLRPAVIKQQGTPLTHIRPAGIGMFI